MSRIIPRKVGLETAIVSILQDIKTCRRLLGIGTLLLLSTCYRQRRQRIYIYNDREHGLRKLLRIENLAKYKLIYKRFTYLRLNKLRNLYKVTILKRPVLVPINREIYRVCKLTKLRNRINKVLFL